MGVTLEWNKPVKQVAKDALGGDAALVFLASEARRLMNPYVPMDTGALADTVDTYVENGTGKVHYRQPYARRLFFGEGYNFSMEKHPKAAARWDEAMLRDRKADLVRAVQNFVRRQGGLGG